MNRAFFELSPAVLAAVVLVGCASPGAYKIYDGPDRAAAETAVIQFPYVLDVMAINGEKADIPSSVKNSAATYELVILPGHHEMAVRYADPFANYEDQYTDRSGGNRIARTAPFFLTFDAVAGGRYTVEYQTARQDSSLKQNEVKVWVVDQGSGDVSGKMSDRKGSAETTPPAESMQVAPAVVVDASGRETVEVPVGKGADAKPLPSINAADQLKFWWYRANADERQNFLRWMREEK